MAEEAGGINLTKQLFLDDEMLQSKAGVQRMLHKPAKYQGNPLVSPHAPWIHTALIFGSVIREGNDWRMWCFCGTEFGRAVCYARSCDGLEWVQDDLDVFEYQGKPTNCVINDQLVSDFGELYTVLLNPTPKSEDERYLGFLRKVHNRPEDSPYYGVSHTQLRRPKWYTEAEGGQWVEHGGFYIARSSDGIHWSVPERYAFDFPTDISYLMYDERIQKYVVYGRHIREPFLRTVQRLESGDLRNWSPSQVQEVLAPDRHDPEHAQIYSMMVMNSGDQYIGFPQIYHPKPGLLDIQLASSRDGINWQRVADRQSWLELGAPGQWDRFNQCLASAPVRVGDELWFYYSGRTYRHGGHEYKGQDNGPTFGAIGLAKIRFDGFVSLTAGFAPGFITTKPLTCSGNQLRLNVYSPFGKVNVEILHPTEDRIIASSDAITADSVDETVVWNSMPTLPAIDGEFRLRFHLINAELYSYCFESALG